VAFWTEAVSGAVSPLRPGDLSIAEAPLSHPLIPSLTDLANRVAEPAGLTVRQVVLLTHHIPQTVQVVVERNDGTDVTLEACAALSGPLGEALEEAGLIDSAYVLEVSSPGLGDVLQTDRDFSSFRGFPVEVRLRAEGGSAATRTGLLLGRSEDTVSINVRGRTVRLPRDSVLEVRLTHAQDP
jgi:ribosome maturation factor RimP